MSRIAKEPVELPSGVEFSQVGNDGNAQGRKGALSLDLNSEVEVAQEDNGLQVKPRSRFAIRSGHFGYHACAAGKYGHRAFLKASRKSSNWSASVIVRRLRAVS